MDKQKNKIPLVRFPEFKEGWEHKQLNELLTVSKAKNGDLKYGKENVLSVSGESGIVNQIEHLGRSYAGASVHNYGVVELNQIVYTKSPLKVNPYGIIKLNKGKAGIVSTLYAVYTVNEKADGEFIEYYFSLDANLNRYLRPLVRKGAKNDMKISNEYVLNDRIYAPQLEEQKRISHFFNIVDRKLNQLQEKLKGLEEYKKGMMQQIFKQQLRFKDEKGQNFPDWQIKKLGEVGTALIGLTYSPKDVVESNGTLVLRSSNVQNKRLAFEDNVYVKGEIAEKNFVKENDILICARNGSRSLIGKSALISKEYENCAFGAFMSIYRSDSNKFFFHVFQTEIFDKQITQHLGATINQITNKSLISFKFPIPSLKEQTKIVNFLSKIDDKIDVVNEQIETTIAYKKGMLQKMFCN
ncbi:conserved hypothetical protein [Tenacibaculum maritimum]|uniref:restriction endonuclease subunit S n=1 Tax=Tenacibaculum maritimum TaxID=107401 RepID=UPI0012E505ED|nr:restriction endonuclease subunit S [Tenacibaculum maritimum]CAA0228795.1 conserved hypothetical protein [Tenacibaculum maritimum]